MSTSTESPPPVAVTPQPPPAAADIVADDDIMKDIVVWRKKKASAMVLVASSATWVLVQIYEFNFLTLASWVAMAIVASLFLWGNLLRLLRKQPPNISVMGDIPKESAIETAKAFRRLIEEAVRWMIGVGAESDVVVFGGVVVGFYVLSVIGSWFHLLTLLYIGVVVGMSVPVIYVKNEDKIKRCWECVKMKGRQWYEIVDDKVLRKIKDKVSPVVLEKKEKKFE